MNDTMKDEKGKKKFNWESLWFWIISIIVIVIFITMLFPGLIRFDKGARLLYSCTGNLRNIGLIITNYSTDHKGHYPQNLEILVEQKYFSELPVCPVTGESYIYEIDGWNSFNFAVRCPNPEKHKVRKKLRYLLKQLQYSSGPGVRSVSE